MTEGYLKGEEKMGKRKSVQFSFAGNLPQFSTTPLKITLKSKLTYKTRKPIFCTSNTLLFNSAAINTHPDGKHPEQLNKSTYHFFYFSSKTKKKQR